MEVAARFRRWLSGVTFAAGLLGAAGVALSAVAAHRVPDPQLATAALFLILHAAGALALVSRSLDLAQPGLFLAGATLMLAGAGLFSGDIAARAFLGDRLFPMAAPIGGSSLILAWLVVALGGVRALVSRR